jgi:hypothetical protein
MAGWQAGKDGYEKEEGTEQGEKEEGAGQSFNWQTKNCQDEEGDSHPEDGN